MIIIIDYQVGNIGSILNMLKKIGAPASIASDPGAIEKADRIILPGVGSFDQGMANLDRLGFLPVLHDKVMVRKTPILGICLGMQLMTCSSEEGKTAGLSWINARTERFRHDPGLGLKVPHMGWNQITQVKQSVVFRDMYPDPRFYFVHSYHVVCNEPDDVLTTTRYGYEFTSSFQHDNVLGVQFHPEKSHKFGMRLLKTFSEADLC